MEKKQSDYDLQGIDAISEFTRQSHVELLSWKRGFDFPMVKDNAIYCANKAEIIAWLAERGVDLQTINNTVLDRYRMRAAIKSGNREPRHGGKVLRNIGDIAKTFHLDLSYALNLQKNRVDFPIPRGQKSFEISADSLQDWFDLAGIKTGVDTNGRQHERGF